MGKNGSKMAKIPKMPFSTNGRILSTNGRILSMNHFCYVYLTDTPLNFFEKSALCIHFFLKFVATNMRKRVELINHEPKENK